MQLRQDKKNKGDENERNTVEFASKDKMPLTTRHDFLHFFLNNLTISTAPALTAFSIAVLPFISFAGISCGN